MAPTWPNLLTALVRGEDLADEDVSWAMDEILCGNASPVQVAGFAVALRAKGESVTELATLADRMLAFATPITLDREAVDVVGTGGDRANTVNVSTMAAITAAAAGAKVVKHGNRAASSACGTADVLEALGVAIDVPPEAQQRVLDEVGIVFLFATMYHPSLRHAGPTRRELGIATSFNLLGPLANPARPHAQAVGVADARGAALMAQVLARRGSRGLVFHGHDGLDELTTTTTSDFWLIGDGAVTTGSLDPARLGLRAASAADLVGGPPDVNAEVARRVFGGQSGPVRDIVLLNAAAALLAFAGPSPESDIESQLAQHLTAAATALDSGAASSVLRRWAAATQAAVS